MLIWWRSLSIKKKHNMRVEEDRWGYCSPVCVWQMLQGGNKTWFPIKKQGSCNKAKQRFVEQRSLIMYCVIFTLLTKHEETLFFCPICSLSLGAYISKLLDLGWGEIIVWTAWSTKILFSISVSDWATKTNTASDKMIMFMVCFANPFF